MVNAGLFREDLFRLAVLLVRMPSLRRREDIPLLAEHLMPPNAQGRLSPELLRELATRTWPGNIREFRNFLQRAAALGAREAFALTDSKPPGSDAAPPNASVPPQSPPPSPSASLPAGSLARRVPRGVARRAFQDHPRPLARSPQAAYIRAMVERHQRDTDAISKAAGLDRSYVYRLLRKHGHRTAR